jgi:mxaA protein
MKARHHLLSLVLAASLLSASLNSVADVILPSVDNKFVSVQEINPTRDAGFFVGDKLQRTMILTVKQPYELIKESLPIVGYEHRYRGQVSGIELTAIDMKEAHERQQTVYTIHLEYQVFKSGRVVKPAILRGEIVKLRQQGSQDIKQFRMPSFNFRTSPLSVYGEVNLKNEMSPFVAPLKLHADKEWLALKVATGVLAVCLLGLVYILAANTWLPRMGGAFAKAYRKLGKLPDDAQGLQQAISTVHEALHQVAGHSVFGNGIEHFLQQKPGFTPARPEIERFFALSRQVFFDASTPLELGIPPREWLKKFCRHMRDCERGLKPEVHA